MYMATSDYLDQRDWSGRRASLLFSVCIQNSGSRMSLLKNVHFMKKRVLIADETVQFIHVSLACAENNIKSQIPLKHNFNVASVI